MKSLVRIFSVSIKVFICRSASFSYKQNIDFKITNLLSYVFKNILPTILNFDKSIFDFS